MKNQDIHKKIENTLASIEGIKRAKANPFLLTRILEQLNQPKKIFVQPKIVRRIVVSFILILALNVGAGFISFKKTSNQNNNGTSTYFSNHVYQY